MPNVVDLTPCAAARCILQRVLDERGLGFFLARAGRGAARLDNRRIAWIVEAARRRSRRAPAADDLSRARRIVRRELVRRLAEQLVAAGL